MASEYRKEWVDLHGVSKSRSFWKSDDALLLYIGLLSVIIHLVIDITTTYGYFRDELYYIACSDHLDWGYVDQPPFSLVILALSRLFFGESLPALRLLPALSGGWMIFLTGRMARELGGGRFSQTLAAVVVLIAPVYLSIFDIYSMNSFDFLFWALCMLILIRIFKTGDEKLWVLFGVLIGLGLQNKLSILFLCVGLTVGMLLSSHRRWFFRKWFWIGGLTAFLIYLPHILWQMANDWPTIEFMRNATEYKNLPIPPLAFLTEQVLMLHPLSLIIWVPGLLYLFFAREGRRYRPLAFMYITLLVVFMAKNGKPYYQAPTYVILIAAGGIVIERFIEKRKWNWLKSVVIVFLVAGGIFTAPIVLPLLPPETFIRYAKAIGVEPGTGERGEVDKLGQQFSDMFGWPEMAATVSEVFHSLTPREQNVCAILTRNYGQAGAIDFFGRELGLPKAISGHNSYWFWGPGDYTGEVMIIIGGNIEDYAPDFESCELAAVIIHEYARSFESNLPVYICRGIRRPLREHWLDIRIFI